MQALWLTDVHLNFLGRQALDHFLREIGRHEADCILLSGDIGEAPDVVGFLKKIGAAVEVPVYFVLGNHDFYKGSIAKVRARIRRLAEGSPRLAWLNAEEVVELTPSTALVGHDSWADGRFGDYEESPVELNDFLLIDELLLPEKTSRLAVMQELAAEAAEHFRCLLPRALESHRKVVVVTHVPPFREASWHQGRISDPDWLPYFSAKAVGDVLRAAMERHPEREMLVLCGHTHGAGECEILPNLRVLTGDAVYGRPRIQRILDLR